MPKTAVQSIQEDLIMSKIRVFSFNIADNDMRLFARATEEYILNQLGHSFKSLEFYKSVIR